MYICTCVNGSGHLKSQREFTECKLTHTHTTLLSRRDHTPPTHPTRTQNTHKRCGQTPDLRKKVHTRQAPPGQSYVSTSLPTVTLCFDIISNCVDIFLFSFPSCTDTKIDFTPKIHILLRLHLGRKSPKHPLAPS